MRGDQLIAKLDKFHGGKRLKLKEEIRKNLKAMELYKKIWHYVSQYELNDGVFDERNISISIEVFSRYCKTLDPQIPICLEETLNKEMLNCKVCRSKQKLIPISGEDPSNRVSFKNQDRIIEDLERDAMSKEKFTLRFSYMEI